MATKTADSSIFKSLGSFPKYILDAERIPVPLNKKSNLLKYIAIISCFVY